MKKLLLSLLTAAALPAVAAPFTLVDEVIYISDWDNGYIGEFASDVAIDLEEGSMTIENVINSGSPVTFSFFTPEAGQFSGLYPEDVYYEAGQWLYPTSAKGGYIDVNWVDYDDVEVNLEMLSVYADEGYTYMYCYTQEEIEDPEYADWYKENFDIDRPIYYACATCEAWEGNTGVMFYFDLTFQGPGEDDSVATIMPGKVGEVQYFDLQGRRVNHSDLTDGIYVRRMGDTTQKVVVRK